MQITLEQVQKDKAATLTAIAQMTKAVKEAKRRLARLEGALEVMNNLEHFIQLPDPETYISPENAKVQEAEETRTMTMDELAEAVGGCGATAEVVPVGSWREDATAEGDE